MLAKITSELGKPAGLVVLSRAEALERFAADSPGLIPGIGPKSVAKLEAMGIRTLAELRAQDPAALEQSFGPRQGRWLHSRARFEDETPITVVRETKSQSTEITFDVDVRDRAELEGHLKQLAEELCRRLGKRELEGRTIGIKIRLDDWTNVTRSHTVERRPTIPRWSARSLSTCCAPTTRSGRCGCSACGSPASTAVRPPRPMTPRKPRCSSA